MEWRAHAGAANREPLTVRHVIHTRDAAYGLVAPAVDLPHGVRNALLEPAAPGSGCGRNRGEPGGGAGAEGRRRRRSGGGAPQALVTPTGPGTPGGTSSQYFFLPHPFSRGRHERLRPMRPTRRRRRQPPMRPSIASRSTGRGRRKQQHPTPRRAQSSAALRRGVPRRQCRARGSSRPQAPAGPTTTRSAPRRPASASASFKMCHSL